MNFIKQTFLWTILIASLALLYHVYSIRYVECKNPLVYVIGKVDSRFGVGRDELREITDDASKVWEDSFDKDLFVYKIESAPENKFEEFLSTYIDKYYTRPPIIVNLIYDERQQIAEENRTLASRIDNTKESAEEIKSQFLKLQEKYKEAKDEYESMLSEYKKGQRNRVEMENQANEINSLVDEINALVKKYNYLVKEVNINVEVINKTAGQEFEEGEYVSDRTGERINIYEFENRFILKRILAHELGHALGMEHNDNPTSIMYYLNKSSNLNPTQEDLASLSDICKVK